MTKFKNEQAEAWWQAREAFQDMGAALGRLSTQMKEADAAFKRLGETLGDPELIRAVQIREQARREMWWTFGIALLVIVAVLGGASIFLLSRG